MFVDFAFFGFSMITPWGVFLTSIQPYSLMAFRKFLTLKLRLFISYNMERLFIKCRG